MGLLQDVSPATTSTEPWPETQPAQIDMKPDSIEAAVRWVDARLRDRRFGAQLVVMRRGQVVLDRAVGTTNRGNGSAMTPLDRFLIYSAGKPFAAMCVHLLAERGLVSLDAPVSNYWPEYAQNGKDKVTVRMVLQHRSGAPMSGKGSLAALGEVFDMRSWDKSIDRIEKTKPWYEPGSAPGYQFLSFGFVCGEIVRRVTGTPIQQFFEENFLRPLGLTRTSFGLPKDAWDERVVNWSPGGERINVLIFNRRSFREAVAPAATTATTAREMALYYEMLRRGGELGGARIVSPSSVEAAVEVSSDGEVDQLVKYKVRWGHGFMLGGVTDDKDIGLYMGRGSSRDTFGHAGEACCTAWCDPGRELVFVYLTNKVMKVPLGIAEHGELSDLILQACN